MKIAIFHNLPSSGALRCVYEYARELSRKGHELHLFIPQTADNEFISLKNYLSNSVVFPFVYRKSLSNIASKAWNFLSLISRLDTLYKEVASRIDDGNFDAVLVFHCQFTKTPAILKYLRTRSLFYLPEPLREAYEADQIPSFSISGFPRYVMLKILKEVDAANLKHAKLILTNSYYSRESIFRAYACESKVSYLGVDTGFYRPLNLARENLVVSVGFLIPSKGHRFVIEALGNIKREIRPRLAIFAYSGEKNEETFLMELARKKEVRVEILFKATDESLLNHYNRAKAVCYAPYLEPFGFVPLEAMACGTPVIGVKEAGLRETILHNENGLLSNRDVCEYAEMVRKLLENDDLSKRLVEKGIEIVRKNWTWEKATDTLLGFI